MNNNISKSEKCAQEKRERRSGEGGSGGGQVARVDSCVSGAPSDNFRRPYWISQRNVLLEGNVNKVANFVL